MALYRPSSGTEGADFQDRWCCRCEMDAKFQANPDAADGCPIVAATFVYDVTDPNYPKEWTYDKKGEPCCTAFVPIGEPIPYRCPDTPDLFGATASARKDVPRA